LILKFPSYLVQHIADAQYDFMRNDKEECTAGLTAKNYVHRLFIGSNFHERKLPEVRRKLQQHNMGHEDK
jgi:hypothetical protein